MIRKIIILVFCSFLAAGCQEKETTVLAGNQLAITTQSGKDHKFEVELALSPEMQIAGLMYRESLPENAGMLFYFNDDQERSFWMKNTLIPLDMIFIRGDGVIHHIHENAIPHDLTGIPSNGPVAAVLEINGGVSRKLGIAKGDTVKHALFGNNPP